MVTGILKGLGQAFAVGLPTLFVLIWTIDAPLVPGADVFILALIQFVFIIVFVGWVRRSWPEPADNAANAD